jgi:hypothetical protein
MVASHFVKNAALDSAGFVGRSSSIALVARAGASPDPATLLEPGRRWRGRGISLFASAAFLSWNAASLSSRARFVCSAAIAWAARAISTLSCETALASALKRAAVCQAQARAGYRPG